MLAALSSALIYTNHLFPGNKPPTLVIRDKDKDTYLHTLYILSIFFSINVSVEKFNHLFRLDTLAKAFSSSYKNSH
jgi:hypothetical protein